MKLKTHELMRFASDERISKDKLIAIVDACIGKGQAQDGGAGSGNFGHKGRPGQRGGSGKGGGSGKKSMGSVSWERPERKKWTMAKLKSPSNPVQKAIEGAKTGDERAKAIYDAVGQGGRGVIMFTGQKTDAFPFTNGYFNIYGQQADANDPDTHEFFDGMFSSKDKPFVAQVDEKATNAMKNAAKTNSVQAFLKSLPDGTCMIWDGDPYTKSGDKWAVMNRKNDLSVTTYGIASYMNRVFENPKAVSMSDNAFGRNAILKMGGMASKEGTTAKSKSLAGMLSKQAIAKMDPETLEKVMSMPGVISDPVTKYGSKNDVRPGEKLNDQQITDKFRAMKGAKKTDMPTAGYTLWYKKGMDMAPFAESAYNQQVERWRKGEGYIASAQPQDAAKARQYTSGHGVTSNLLTAGTGVTRIAMEDLNPEAFKSANTLSQHTMMVDGKVVLTPEREQLHRAAVDELFKNARKPAQGQPKVFTMLGGGSAAGKGTIQSGDYVKFPSKIDSPVVDADELKRELPEYVDQPDRKKAAAYAHEQSSALAKRCMEAAFANGYNCTLDGTGDGSVKSMLKKIKQARDAGYQVNGTYVTCPTQLALQRSDRRAEKTGRFVPHKDIGKIHSAVSKIWPQIASEFDHTELYDTDQGDGNPPKLIASCKRGEKIQIHDQKLYDKFLAKADEKWE